MKRWMAVLLMSMLAAQAAEMGSLRYAGELKEKPFLDSAKVSDLAVNAVVEILARQGAWMQIKTADGQVGWVKMLGVRTGVSDKTASGATGLSSLLSSLKTGSSATTATTGVKGVDEEQIKNANPDPAQLAKLNGFAISAAEAAKFAQAGKLVAQHDLAYLPTPSNK